MECSNCCYWKKDYGSEYEIGWDTTTLGQCKRYPPSVVEKITAISKQERDRWDQLYNKASEAFEEWESNKYENLEKHRNRLRDQIDRAKESISTATRPDSVKHWTEEVKKLQEKLDNIEVREFSNPEYIKILEQGYDPPLKTTDIYVGTWPITLSENVCGEWRRNWP